MLKSTLSSTVGFRCAFALAGIASVVATYSAVGQQFVDETATRLPGGLAGIQEYTNYVSVGDLDGDIDLDIVYANGGGYMTASPPIKLRVMINNGSGVFTDETDARTGGLTFIARGVELGDVERDGDLDIIIAQDFNRQPTLLINGGTGFFTDQTLTRLPIGTFSSMRAQFGDVDNDGDLDIYLTNSGSGNRWGPGRGKLWLNNGSGVYTDFTNTNTVNEVVSGPLDCIFGDVDGDFDLDIHIGSVNADSRLYKNNGAGTFVASVPPIAPGATAYSYDFGDMDSDGDFDLLGANAGPSNSELLLVNNGAGTFTPGSFTGATTDDNDSKFIDIDNDGDYDLVIARIAGAERIYINGGPPSFTYSLGANVITAVTDSSLDVKVADFNNDGRYDIFTAQGESGAFLNRLYMNNTGAVDTRAPTILRTEQLSDSSTPGPFAVRVEIIDAHTSDRGFHDRGITLNWRLGGAGAFNTVPMHWSGNSLWRGLIPAQTGSGIVQYFITARDFANNLATGPTQVFFVTLPATCTPNIVNSGTSANRVDVDDLLAVISQWGPCSAPPAPCPANIVNTGTSVDRVDVDDLLAVISGWGPCP